MRDWREEVYCERVVRWGFESRERGGAYVEVGVFEELDCFVGMVGGVEACAWGGGLQSPTLAGVNINDSKCLE